MATSMVRKLATFPDEMWKRVDDYRYRNRIASETEAVRRLVLKGLESDAPQVPAHAGA
ncbi:hypothetical protein [Azospirillum agricola]|uniref:hypothetical protein n=1 Tax=Azospirillum agricola TaxID=1720247 RepID=UPI000A0F09FF|nr:hypothetical protein [Azospirillum agricola]SMH29497.1 hypothetical protein SAMN02982994_0190 [Azospirillum lipoferum]